ncbi:hypothetical protein [Nocardia xishanensis]|uniref:WXG100 family type VII secretion target n=1 Tax=Nocardia xishanensis TaxID=238964 RepID=A0ABW7X4C2_9NOCA
MTYYKASGDATVEQMLDGGAEGLLYFENYLPRYNRAHEKFGLGHGDIPDYKELYPTYDFERGMDLKVLANIADTLSKAIGATGAELDKQKVQLAAMPSVWQGQAGDAAHAILGQQAARAEIDRASAIAAALTVSATVTGLRSIIKNKAETVGAYWHKDKPDIDNTSRKAIDQHIYNAEHYMDYSLGRDSMDWLRDVFVPHVEGTYNNFKDVCKRTENDVRRIYGSLADSLAQLDTAAYPAPAEPETPKDTTKKENNNPGPPGPPGPSTQDTTKTTQDTKTTDDSTNPGNTSNPSNTTTTASTDSLLSGLASLSQVAEELSPLSSTLTSLVSQGMSSLTSAIEDGIEQATEKLGELVEPSQAEDKDGDGKPDQVAGTPGAEFDLAGKHLKFEMGLDGKLELVVTEDGQTREFNVTFDERGNPVISTGQSETPEEPKLSTPEPEQDQPPAPSTPEYPTGGVPAPTNEPVPTGGVPGIPPTRKEEDNEHESQVLPPEAPFDTGAELAEAGPL